MGLLDLFRKKTATAASPGRGTEEVYEGVDDLDVVGESGRQEALLQLVGGPRQGVTSKDIQAVLIPEPNNPYDPNAIGVWIKGLQVGYVGREDAQALNPGLLALLAKHPKKMVALNGVISGMSLRADGGPGMLGVHLDYDPSHFGLESRPGLPRMRTGLSLAMGTDSEDDSYDLAWWNELDEDPFKRIDHLRGLIEIETAPISRHYVLMELEYRLYRHREDIADALAEYDQLADLHHAELSGNLRGILLAKFGKLPELDTYRQASIRHTRAKEHEQALMWAQRGLAMYGQDASRAEWVDDLQNRVQRLTSQLDRKVAAESKAQAKSAQEPKARVSSPVRTPPALPGDFVMETLQCQGCGAGFERVRTRGRKPMLCPTCSDRN